nr:protein asi3 [Quercus suber]
MDAYNTSYVPSAKDLLLVVPRLAQRAGSLAFYRVPEAVDSFAGKIWNGGSIIADATGRQTMNSTITNTSNVIAQSTVVVLRNSQAIILNRTHFYASSRQALRLRWHARLALYLIPICTFVVQMYHVLQFMRCQTSPDFAQLRWGDPLKNISAEFGGEGGFVYNLSSVLLFWEDDATCCAARSMSLASVGGNLAELRGSTSLLFWFFIALCTSQFFETLTCALQGTQPVAETGMTIFEHSLAFAECETMLTSALGFSMFGVATSSPDIDSAETLTRLEILQRLNVPPEVLLICLVSCLSHLSSAVLAITGLRNRVRLVNTAIWSCSYMAALLWSFMHVVARPNTMNDIAVLRFPTVCTVGFLPHLLIFTGIMICGFIYGLALLVTAMSVPDDVAASLSIRQRFGWAYHNLQANVQFSVAGSIRIKMSEDFYTTLLKLGFTVLTAASEAVYLNEGSRIQVAQMTWVERKRMNELAASIDQRKPSMVPAELVEGEIAKGLGHVDTQHGANGSSPYARERRSRPSAAKQDQRLTADMDTGLGMIQRRSRMQLTYEYVSAMFWLVVMAEARVALSMLRGLGIGWHPTWLTKAAGLRSNEELNQRNLSAQTRHGRSDDLKFWMVGLDGILTLPKDDDVDVEMETRRRLATFGGETDEEHLSDHLYGWWRTGGWFGSADGSGDYQETTEDDDATSMVSMSTNASTTNDWDVHEDDGRSTPTQRSPYGDQSHDGTPSPDAGLDLSMLSRLLNPLSPEDKEEARLLSYSLQADRPTTRSHYRQHQHRSRTQLLKGLRGSATAISSADDDEYDLENFILAQREKAQAKESTDATWESGAEGMGESGPQCVVCQSTPRTVLVWPCGCLSMCDDCRVGLAARNHTKCICCRSDVAAYSRLYVP